MNNSNGNKKTYARLNGGIESSFANNENGFITFEIISNGQLGNLVQQEKVRITSRGYVGIGTNNPTAQLHTTASVRFENIANGTGSYLVVDANGNIYKSNSGPANRSTADNSVDLKNMQSQIEQLQLEIKQLKNQIEKK